MHVTQMELSKLNGSGDAVKRAPVRRPRQARSGGRRSLRLLDRDVAVRRLQDFRHVAGEAAIHGTHGQRLRPHGVVGEAMDAHERGRGKLAAQFSQLGKAHEFEIHDGERGPEPRDGAAEFVQTMRSCYTVKLLFESIATSFAVSAGSR